MNFLDFIIIYLTCGAPFAVEYFIKHRVSSTHTRCLIKASLILIFWLPYSLNILWQFIKEQNKSHINFDNDKDLNVLNENKIQDIQKKMESVSLKINGKYSLFEFRDLVNRYKGFMLETQVENKTPDAAEREIFTVSNSSSVDVSAICLHRRNRNRLFFHQRRAQKDFLAFLTATFRTSVHSNGVYFILLAFELTVLLKDFEMQKKLKQNFPDILPNNSDFVVKFLEYELWNTEIHEELQTSQI